MRHKSRFFGGKIRHLFGVGMGMKWLKIEGIGAICSRVWTVRQGAGGRGAKSLALPCLGLPNFLRFVKVF